MAAAEGLRTLLLFEDEEKNGAKSQGMWLASRNETAMKYILSQSLQKPGSPASSLILT